MLARMQQDFLKLAPNGPGYHGCFNKLGTCADNAKYFQSILLVFDNKFLINLHSLNRTFFDFSFPDVLMPLIDSNGKPDFGTIIVLYKNETVIPTRTPAYQVLLFDSCKFSAML